MGCVRGEGVTSAATGRKDVFRKDIRWKRLPLRRARCPTDFPYQESLLLQRERLRLVLLPLRPAWEVDVDPAAPIPPLSEMRYQAS